MSTQTSRPEIDAIVAFLRRIGLKIEFCELGSRTFVPGISIREGVLLVDLPALTYPGDLLHEAGHLAVMTEQQRSTCDADAGSDAGMEMAAIAWSYAAALQIGIDPLAVFHPDGYKGGGAQIVENFSAGRYFGVPLLQWYGLTECPVPPAFPEVSSSHVVYPRMKRWVRE